MLSSFDALLKGIKYQIKKSLGPGNPAKPLGGSSSRQTSALLKSSLSLPGFNLQLLGGVTPPSSVPHSPAWSSVLTGWSNPALHFPGDKASAFYYTRQIFCTYSALQLINTLLAHRHQDGMNWLHLDCAWNTYKVMWWAKPVCLVDQIHTSHSSLWEITVWKAGALHWEPIFWCPWTSQETTSVPQSYLTLVLKSWSFGHYNSSEIGYSPWSGCHCFPGQSL